jgi:hypothetical protein
MRLIVEIDLNPVEGHTMTERKLKAVRPRLEALLAQDRDLLKALVKEALDQILWAEMSEFLGAAPGERNASRAGHRAGYYERGLVTRVRKIELRIPLASILCVSNVPACPRADIGRPERSSGRLQRHRARAIRGRQLAH